MKLFPSGIKKNVPFAHWFIVAIGGVILLIGALTTVILSEREGAAQQKLLFQVYQHQINVFADLSAERIRYQNQASLEGAVISRLRQDPLVKYAFVVNNDGIVLASLDERDIDTRLPERIKKTEPEGRPLYQSDEVLPCCEKTHRYLVVEDAILQKDTYSQNTRRAQAGEAIFDFTKDIYFFEEKMGTLKIGISQEPLRQAISRTRAIFLAQAVITILLCISVISKISQQMMRPLATLTAEIHRLSLSADKGISEYQIHLEKLGPVVNRSVPLEVAELQESLIKLKEYHLKNWNVQIDYQKALESKHLELRRLDALKDEFMANTSHELRTPLNGIIGLTESLLEETVEVINPDQHEMLMSVSLSARRLANLVNDILDFSSIRYGRLKVIIKPLAISPLVNEVLELLSAPAAAKRITLRNMLPQNLPVILADEERVVQVLLNLLGNALKFTDSGWIAIHAQMKEQFLEVSIEDTGTGIASESLEVIFNPFEQAPLVAAKGSATGVGLGLAISRELIRLQGGEIGARSELGKGSQFWFTLPLAGVNRPSHTEGHRPYIESDSQNNTRSLTPAASFIKTRSVSLIKSSSVEVLDKEQMPIRQPSVVSREGSDSQPHRDRILIVDDEPINLQLLNRILSRENYDVKSVTGGKEALRDFPEFRPDVVLLDMMMPEVSGIEVCTKIRQRWSLAELPIIFLTAKNQVDDLVACFEAGGNDFISKPISKGELLARVKAHLTVSRLYCAASAGSKNRQFKKT